MDKLHSEAVDRLFRAIRMLKTEEDCYEFFEDLCTVREIEDMAQRLTTAILLKKGENYQTISEKANVSTATISRVSKCLNYGTGGYGKILKALEEEK